MLYYSSLLSFFGLDTCTYLTNLNSLFSSLSQVNVTAVPHTSNMAHKYNGKKSFKFLVQGGDPDYHQKFIICPLHYCRHVLKIFIKIHPQYFFIISCNNTPPRRQERKATTGDESQTMVDSL